jgi:hypothetical protein
MPVHGSVTLSDATPAQLAAARKQLVAATELLLPAVQSKLSGMRVQLTAAVAREAPAAQERFKAVSRKADKAATLAVAQRPPLAELLAVKTVAPPTVTVKLASVVHWLETLRCAVLANQIHKARAPAPSPERCADPVPLRVPQELSEEQQRRMTHRHGTVLSGAVVHAAIAAFHSSGMHRTLLVGPRLRRTMRNGVPAHMRHTADDIKVRGAAAPAPA